MPGQQLAKYCWSNAPHTKEIKLLATTWNNCSMINELVLTFVSSFENSGGTFSTRRLNLDATGYTCDICGVKMPSFSALQTHKRRSHNARVDRRAHVTTDQCPACGRRFASIRGAKDHFQLYRCQQSKSYEFVLESSAAQVSTPDIRSYTVSNSSGHTLMI